MQLFDNGALRRQVERRERLIEKKQFRTGRKRACERDALLLSAGKRSRPPISELRCVKKLQHLGDPVIECFPRMTVQPKGDISPAAEVRKQCRLLGNEADAPLSWRNVQVCSRVGQEASAEGDASTIGNKEAGQNPQQRGLTRAGGAEKDGPAGVKLEAGLEAECPRRSSTLASSTAGLAQEVSPLRLQEHQRNQRGDHQQKRGPVGLRVLEVLHLVVNQD